MHKLYRTFLVIFFVSFNLVQAQQNRPKVGVVLSGGGAKGYAHIGALKIIEKAGVQIDYIGGTSIGAIVGGLYASGYSADELEQIMYSLDLNNLILNEKSRRELPLFDKTYREKYLLELPFDDFKLGFPNAISSGQGTVDELTYLFRHVHDIENFNQLDIPFVCVATKLSTGESVVFNEGYLPQIVMASGAYPTLFEPVKIKGELYVDGGVRNNYPVQEVLDLGADYIIGIDLQEGLMDDEQLNSATKVIEQLITYNIAEKSAEQSQLVDLSILPDLKGFSVTSFEDKDSIIQAGTLAAENVWDELKSIAAAQGHPTLKKQIKNEKEFLLLTELEIKGLDKYNESYVRGKLGINTPEVVNYTMIRDGIKTLYSSGNFNNIYYRINTNPAGHKTLSIYLQENPSKQSIKFGLHYDDLFKTGLLLNYTNKHLLFKNSTFSADFVLGDFPRYEINYFIDNGIFPSIGINSSFKRFKAETSVRTLSDEFPNVLLNYNFSEFINRIYLQSTLYEKYAIGAGFEHQYLNINTNNLPKDNPFQFLEGSYFLSAYAYLRADNLDNPNFPRKGIKIDGGFKYSMSSNADNFTKTSMIDIQAQVNHSLNTWLSIHGFWNFGTFLGSHPTFSQKFTLGGFVEQNFMNYTRFYGLPFFYAGADNLFLVGGKLQGKVLKNHYLSAHVNFANLEEELEDLKLSHYTYTGVGLGYGYDSPLGPIIGLWTYSPNTKSGIFNVSLGFWF